MHLEMDIAAFTLQVAVFILGLLSWLGVIAIVALVMVSHRIIDELLKGDAMEQAIEDATCDVVDEDSERVLARLPSDNSDDLHDDLQKRRTA